MSQKTKDGIAVLIAVLLAIVTFISVATIATIKLEESRARYECSKED